MWRAVADKDLPAFQRESKRFLEIGRDIDTLLTTRHEYLLGRWIADARAWGTTPAEKDDYENDAREIPTTWCNEYVHREWNGIIGRHRLAILGTGSSC